MNRIDYYPCAIKGVEIKHCANSIHAYKDHLHQELSIGYIEKGSTILNINGIDYSVSENEAIIINPFVSHRCQPKDIDNWQFTMIYIQECYLIGLDFRPSISIRKLTLNELNQLKELTKVLAGETPIFEKENMLVSVLMTFLEGCEVKIIFNNNSPVEEVLEYIRQHYLEELSLADLEHRFQINKYQLIRAFKSIYNTTPSAYQLQLKINYAKSLLKQDSLLAAVALEAGFYDQAHFSKEFKKAYGITPHKYMKSFHQNA